MKNNLRIILFVFAVVSCGQSNKNEKMNAQMSDASFSNYKEALLLRTWRMYPEWASGVGYHNYDSLLNVPDAGQREKELKFISAELDSIKKFDPDSLNDNNRTDYYLILNQLNASDWGIMELKSFEWNPSSYNIGSTFGDMLNNTYDSLDNRLRNFSLRMISIPGYYEAAKKNIKNPTLEHTQLAIDQNLGSLGVFEKDLKGALEQSRLSAEEKKTISERAEAAVAAINGYVAWLKNLKNDQPRSFRLGKDLYKKKFEFDIMSAYTPDEMFKKAVDHKKELHTKMAELAKQLWPKVMGKQLTPNDPLKMIRLVIDKLSLQHEEPDSFQTAIDKQLKELAEFVKKKDLLYMDPSKPLVVRREPDYMAGVAGASINAPGPYDKEGNTYYNVGSLSGWPKEKSESYLREYNHYILQILNIHEAIPGHYAQLIYSNQSPSLIKSILGNGAMVEGWAVYTERMMLEEGYGDNDPAMWLMYYKWNLRATCNFILDYSVHAGNMTKEEAMKLLVDEAFQQQTEADNKWRRVQLTSVQLTSYFTGYTEIYEFREELKKKMGDKFNLKQFHEKFLSYGSSPVKDIRELMLKELAN
jgi:uncharacterized protein (DUF885 family)